MSPRLFFEASGTLNLFRTLKNGFITVCERIFLKHAEIYAAFPHSSSCVDLFLTHDDQMSSEQHFAKEYSDLLILSNAAVNYNFAPLMGALLHQTNITQQYV